MINQIAFKYIYFLFLYLIVIFTEVGHFWLFLIASLAISREKDLATLAPSGVSVVAELPEGRPALLRARTNSQTPAVGTLCWAERRAVLAIADKWPFEL